MQRVSEIQCPRRYRRRKSADRQAADHIRLQSLTRQLARPTDARDQQAKLHRAGMPQRFGAVQPGDIFMERLARFRQQFVAARQSLQHAGTLRPLAGEHKQHFH